MKIFHSNRGRGYESEKQAEAAVQSEILEALELLYKSTDNEFTFQQIRSASGVLRKSISEASSYYIRNKNKFGKILIFAVDDVDLLSKNELENIVKYVIGNLEAKSFKKWFFVRPQTYKNYEIKTKEILQGFFPDERTLPITKLYDLVKHRISAVSELENPPIPFSQHLCSYIQTISDGNLRRALPILEHILCEVTPPTRESQPEDFTKNWIDRVAIRTLVGKKEIPDIHSNEFRTVPYPIVIDILRFLIFTADLAVVQACVQDALKERSRNVFGGVKRVKLGDATPEAVRRPYIRDVDFSVAVKMMAVQQLITKEGNACKLTSLGKVVAIFAAQPYFLEESITAKDDMVEGDNDTYIKYASVKVDHQSIIQNYLLRSF